MTAKKTALPKNWVNIALVAGALGFGLWVWSTRGSITETEREMRKNNVFPAFRRDEITRVELHGQNGDLILERPDGGDAWMITKPIQERADTHAVDTLIGAFEFATRVRSAPDDSPGLAKPRVRGTVTMGRVTFTFAVGDPAPTPAGSTYFHLDGEGSFVVSGDLATVLLGDASTYRTRTVIPYLSIELARLEIRSPSGGKGFAIERMDDVAFRLPDVNMRASREKLDSVWLALGETRASSFLTDDEADRVSKPEIVVKMQPRDGARPPGEVLIGGPCPNHPDDVVLVRKSPTRVSACVPGGLIPRLRAEPADLSDGRLFVTRLDEVESIKIAALPAGGLAIDLARKGGGWTLRAPEARDLASDEADMATSLIGSIVHGEGGTFAPIPGGAFTPTSRVTVVRSESHAEEVIETDGKIVRRLQDATQSATIAIDLARKLAPSLVALRGKAVWTPPVATLDYRTLALDCDGVRQELQRASKWSYTIPAGLPADEAAAIDVADAIARLESQAWVAEKDDGTFGFSGKPCTASLGVAGDGGERTVKLALGRETEKGFYAVIPGAAPVFVVPHAVRDAFARVLVDRGALAFDASKGFELRRAGKTVLVAVGDGGSTPTQLGGLRADDVVHLGPPLADEGFGEPSLEIHAGASTRITIGRATLRRDQKMYFARITGIDTTFAVAKERIDPLLDRFGGPK